MIETNVKAHLEAGESIFIDGQWSGANDSFEVTDPSNPSRVTAKLAVGKSEMIDAAYVAASAAAVSWRETSAQARSALLLKAADLLEAEADYATRRLTEDMGKTARDSRGEVLRGVAILRYFAGDVLQPSGETYPSVDPNTTLMTIEEPLGVVAAITPWNFPVAIPLWKLAPALGFGNTVVWKPASAAAGSAVLICELFEQAGLPAGVLNLVTGGGGELSKAITGNPAMRAVTFTGSGPVGMKIQSALADTTAKLQLELGGKNPAIVLADADLPDAAAQIARGAMLSTGQRCTATSRTYVQREALDQFTDLLVKEVEGLSVGDPFDESTDIGPAASGNQFKTVSEYIALAREEGVTFLAGDVPATDAKNGFFIQPVIVTDVDPGSRLLREEIFGPFLCVVPVDGGFEEALAMANDTEFGLSSAVFTSNLKNAMRFARLTESGVVHINRETAGVEPHVPFGGIKGSSNAQREQGTAARRFFTNTKTVYIRTP